MFQPKFAVAGDSVIEIKIFGLFVPPSAPTSNTEPPPDLLTLSFRPRSISFGRGPFKTPMLAARSTLGTKCPEEDTIFHLLVSSVRKVRSSDPVGPTKFVSAEPVRKDAVSDDSTAPNTSAPATCDAVSDEPPEDETPVKLDPSPSNVPVNEPVASIGS